MARMSLSHALPNPKLQVVETLRLWRPAGEQRMMDVLGRKTGRPAHDDSIPILFPFQN
jgi:hypothetical protein